MTQQLSLNKGPTWMTLIHINNRVMRGPGNIDKTTCSRVSFAPFDVLAFCWLWSTKASSARWRGKPAGGPLCQATAGSIFWASWSALFFFCRFWVDLLNDSTNFNVEPLEILCHMTTHIQGTYYISIETSISFIKWLTSNNKLRAWKEILFYLLKFHTGWISVEKNNCYWDAGSTGSYLHHGQIVQDLNYKNFNIFFVATQLTGRFCRQLSMGLLQNLKNLGPGQGHSFDYQVLCRGTWMCNWSKQERDSVSQTRITTEEMCWHS